MTDLRLRFGKLLSGHRRRQNLTQEKLAEMAGISLDMISKLEIGKTGASFAVIERIAAALQIDAAELFTAQLPGGALNRGAFAGLSERLAGLSESDLNWLGGVIDAALAPRR